MMGLIMLGSILNYLTRSTLAVAASTLLQDLNINEQQYSYIIVAFQIAIMFQPVCGYVMDVLGLRIWSSDLRHGVVIDKHGARIGAQLAIACRDASPARIRRKLR